MDLTFTEEQRMLRETLASFLTDRYTFEQRKAALANAPHWRPDIWRAMAQDLGILGAAFPEDLGGFGGGATENMIVMEEFGRVLATEPYLGTVVIGGGFLQHAGHSGAGDLIGRIMSGDAILAFAHAERSGRFNLSAVETRAEPDGAGWKLNGSKRLVIGAPMASHFVVVARTAGSARERQGISVFLVERESRGISLREYATFDGFLAADVDFADVRLGSACLLGELDNGLTLVERVVDEAVAATCGEAIGVLRRMLDQTLEYTKQRKQFGVAIGSFQVLQHRMADMFVECEQATSMAWLASIRLGDADPAKRAHGVSCAKVQIANSCRKVGQGAIQLHGGMGMTDEMPISHYFKRATMLETLFGSADHHLARIEALQSCRV